MKTLYFKETQAALGVESIELVESTSNKIDERVVDNGKAYRVLDETYSKEDKNESKIVGYIETSAKEDKKARIKEDKIKYSLNETVAVKKEKSISEKVIGYIKVADSENDNEYVALTKKRFPLIPILLFIALLILLLLSLSDKPVSNIVTPEPEKQVTFKDGDKGTGDLKTEQVEFGEQPMFRMKLNCTPNVENGEINLRLESPEEENKELGFVVKVLVLQKVENGEVTEDYSEEPLQVYESPIIYANENIENGKLDTELEAGTYIGRAVYDIYDLEKNMIGQTACRLDINVK